MPELPEVESFARLLQATYAGMVLQDLQFHRPDLRFVLDQNALGNVMRRGDRLLHVSRRGKRLVLQFEAGSVFVSLGMSGHFHAAVLGSPAPHEHVTWVFRGDAGLHALGYVDPRRFGFLSLIPPEAAVDPLDRAAVVQKLLSARERGVKRSVKDFLMDQKVLGGVGNIYALEACFRAGVSPLLSVCGLDETDCESLAAALRKILTLAIRMGGSSVATYRNFHGEKGSFQNVHRVYGREGQCCLRRGCSGTIIRITAGGRGTFLCPVCQPERPEAARHTPSH